VNPGLGTGLEVLREQVGVEISHKKYALKKQQTDRPDGSGPAKPREDEFGNDRLNLEEQEGAGENCDAVDQSMGKRGTAGRVGLSYRCGG
jgi:hypothetical protein